MEQVFAGAPGLQGKRKVGDGECVALIQTYTNAGRTERWRQGAAVLNNRTLRTGTEIATFENGRWPLHRHKSEADRATASYTPSNDAHRVS